MEDNKLEDKTLKALEIIQKMPNPPKILFDLDPAGNECYYVPRNDTVHMVPIGSVKDSDFVRCLFHEAGHSTGAQHRLNRESIKHGMTPPYKCSRETMAREEMTAEIATTCLCEHLGTMKDSWKNSMAHCYKYASDIHPKDLKEAMADGILAAEYILGTKLEKSWKTLDVIFGKN